MKAGDIFVRIAQRELLDDIMPHLPRGTGRESCDRAVRKMSAERAKLPVFGPEFVAPFGDAMRFVDREKRNWYALQPFDGIGPRETFRGEI